jgi:hypothetical protein
MCRHLWEFLRAEWFQGELPEPFDLHEAVTSRIAASLHVQLQSRESPQRHPADDKSDAYDVRLRHGSSQCCRNPR